MQKQMLIYIVFNLFFGNLYSQKINFQNYQSGPIGINKAIKINKKSDKHALGQLFYALNEKGVVRQNKINFASYYEILTYSVGAGCEQGVIIDLRDGKVYSLPIDCPACDSGSEEYYDFQKKSLLFVNTFCDFKTNRKKTNYYLWSEKNKKFNKIK